MTRLEYDDHTILSQLERRYKFILTQLCDKNCYCISFKCNKYSIMEIINFLNTIVIEKKYVNITYYITYKDSDEYKDI